MGSLNGGLCVICYLWVESWSNVMLPSGLQIRCLAVLFWRGKVNWGYQVQNSWYKPPQKSLQPFFNFIYLFILFCENALQHYSSQLIMITDVPADLPECRMGRLVRRIAGGLCSLPGGFVESLWGLSLLLAAVSQCHVLFEQLQLWKVITPVSPSSILTGCLLLSCCGSVLSCFVIVSIIHLFKAVNFICQQKAQV